MSRLIDADELLAQMIGMNDGWFDPRPAYDHESLIKIQPTVDAMPVVHGRWVMDEHPHDGDVRCSACLIAIAQMHERNHGFLNALTGGKWRTFYSYCPNCGAKMDLKEEPNGTDNP